MKMEYSGKYGTPNHKNGIDFKSISLAMKAELIKVIIVKSVKDCGINRAAYNNADIDVSHYVDELIKAESNDDIKLTMKILSLRICSCTDEDKVNKLYECLYNELMEYM